MQGRLADLRHEVALLEAMLGADAAVGGVLLLFRAIAADHDNRPDIRLAGQYLRMFRDELDMPCRAAEGVPASGDGDGKATPHAGAVSPVWLTVGGSDAWPLIRAELGTHLVCADSERLIPVQITAMPLEGAEWDESPTNGVNSVPRRLDELRRQEQEWLSGANSANAAASPYALEPVVRIYQADGPMVDLRSGLTLLTFPSPRELRALLLAGLPQPPEFAVLAASK
jgi:hypothetical protein